jgi:hypothetical protein
MTSFHCATLLALIALASGCAAPAARYDVPADHAASPQAPEAPLPTLSAPASAGAADTGDGGNGGHDDAGADAPAAFTCPMHPEVRSAEPGRCARCGMPLVPGATHRQRGAGASREDGP